MILSNKFIKIQTKKQNIESHNYIFDRYLEFVNKSQFKTSNEGDMDRYNTKKTATNCMLKFDEPIIDYTNLTYEDFDARIYMQTYNVTGKNKLCNCTYIYNSSNNFSDVSNMNINLDINDYIGRKITAIGFFNNWYEETATDVYEYQPDILAFIDVSEYSIYISRDEKIVITRSDDFATNMECDGIDFPKHLAPYNLLKTDYDLNIDTSPVYSRLYSIGFGTSKGLMQEEYKLDNNEVKIEKNNTNFSFYIKTGEKRTIYPSITIQPSNSKYPMKDYQLVEKYPTMTTYPSNTKYPMKSNVKYIIFKYKLCCYDDNKHLIDLDETYTMNYYSPLIAYFKVINKIERRNEI